MSAVTEWLNSINLEASLKTELYNVLNDMEFEDLAEDCFVSAEDFETELSLSSEAAKAIWKHLQMRQQMNEPSNDNINNESSVAHIGDTFEIEEKKSSLIMDKSQSNVKGNIVGFRNLGNTCFMNTAIQCLLQMPYFTHYFFQILESMKKDHELKERKKEEEHSARQTRTQADFAQKMGVWRATLGKGSIFEWQVNVGNERKNLQWISVQIEEINKNDQNDQNDPSDQSSDFSIKVIEYKYQNNKLYCINRDNDDIRPSFDDKNTKQIFNNNGSGWSLKRVKNWVFGTGGSMEPYKQNPFKLSSKGNNFYFEILNMVFDVHLKHRKHDPSNFHHLLGNANYTFGNGAQNDSKQALLIILKEIERGIPNQTEMKDSQFVWKINSDSANRWNKRDDFRLIRKKMDLEHNIVNSCFDRVEVTINECLECGAQERIYMQCRDLDVPIIDKHCKVTILGYEHDKANKYSKIVSKLNQCEVSSDCKIKLAKYHSLSGDNFAIKDIDNYEIVKINSNMHCIDSFTNIVEILDNNSLISDAHGGGRSLSYALFVVKNDLLFTNPNPNPKPKSKSKPLKYIQVPLIQVLPNKTMMQFSQKYKSDIPDPLHISVLNIPIGVMNGNCTVNDLLNQIKNEQIGFFSNVYKLLQFSKFELSVYFDSEEQDMEDDLDLKQNQSHNIVIIFQKPQKNNNSNNNANESDTKTSFDSNSVDLNEIDDKFDTFMQGYMQSASKMNLKEEILFVESKINKINQFINQCSTLAKYKKKLLKKMNYNYSASLKRDLVYYNRIHNELKLFESEIINRNNLVKDTLHHIFNKYAPLSIKMIEKQASSLQNCIKLYLKEDFKLAQDFEVDCCNCGTAPIVRISKYVSIWPKILIIGFDRGDMHGNKAKNNVNFENKLMINDNSNNKYHLFAIGNHNGSMKSGHWFANVEKIGTNEWWYCSDTSVSREYGTLSKKNAMYTIYAMQESN